MPRIRVAKWTYWPPFVILAIDDAGKSASRPPPPTLYPRWKEPVTTPTSSSTILPCKQQGLLMWMQTRISQEIRQAYMDRTFWPAPRPDWDSNPWSQYPCGQELCVKQAVQPSSAPKACILTRPRHVYCSVKATAIKSGSTVAPWNIWDKTNVFRQKSAIKGKLRLSINTGDRTTDLWINARVTKCGVRVGIQKTYLEEFYQTFLHTMDKAQYSYYVYIAELQANISFKLFASKSSESRST
jgi:hypothetical protein